MSKQNEVFLFYDVTLLGGGYMMLAAWDRADAVARLKRKPDLWPRVLRVTMQEMIPHPDKVSIGQAFDEWGNFLWRYPTAAEAEAEAANSE